MVTAKKAGSTIISVISVDGIYSAECAITVTAANSYSKEIKALKKVKPYIASVYRKGKTIRVRCGAKASKINYQVWYKIGKKGKWRSAYSVTSNTKAYYKQKRLTYYYIKVRGYRTYNGTNYYTNWSQTKVRRL